MRGDQFVPQLIVRDGMGALDFYARTFGAVVASRTMTEDGAKLVHGELEIDGHKLFVSDEFPTEQGGSLKAPDTLGGSCSRVTIYTDDADALAARAIANGASELMPVQDMFWGGRYGKILDPFGHEWGINQEVISKTESEVQAASNQYFEQRG